MSNTSKPVIKFRFNKDVATVFDDMMDRSIPFYDEIQSMIVSLTTHFVCDKARVYDLGCATGESLVHLIDACPDRSIEWIGVDSSVDMLDKAKEKLGQRPVQWIQQDLNQPFEFQTAQVVLMVLTLQFIHPKNRDRLIQSICEALAPGGALILVEKVVSDAPLLEPIFSDEYHQFKRKKGYSEQEIAEKQSAIKDVLVPYSLAENTALLQRNGFTQIDTFFKWFNFAGLVCVKPPSSHARVPLDRGIKESPPLSRGGARRAEGF